MVFSVFAFRTPGELLASPESKSWVEIEEEWLARRSEPEWNDVETLDELGVAGYRAPGDFRRDGALGPHSREEH